MHGRRSRQAHISLFICVWICCWIITFYELITYGVIISISIQWVIIFNFNDIYCAWYILGYISGMYICQCLCTATMFMDIVHTRSLMKGIFNSFSSENGIQAQSSAPYAFSLKHYTPFIKDDMATKLNREKKKVVGMKYMSQPQHTN